MRLLLVGATLRLIHHRARLLDDWQGFRADTGQRVSAATLSAWAALLLIGWGWISALWSPDAAIAFGSVWVFSLGWVWAAGLALHGHRAIVRPLADVLLAAAAVTAGMSLWYWKVRSVDARLGWPMGNPLLLASVMVPAILVGAGRLVDRIASLRREGLRGSAVASLVLYVLAIGLVTVALLATGSRGPVLALLAGLALAGWVALRGKARMVWGVAVVAALAMAAPRLNNMLFHAGGGRDASARMRLYAWRNAVDLAWQKPAAGQGAGGFARLATSMATRDDVADPLAMGGQVSSHAHCEMLELLADLGVFGLLIGLAAWGFALTAAGAKARDHDRWMAAAVAGAIAAVFLDACSGVSWRFPGPAAYMATPLALAWMLWRRPRHADATGRGFAWPGLIPAVVGLAVATAGTVDFMAARALYKSEQDVRLADVTRQQWRQAPPDKKVLLARQTMDLTVSSLRQADWAKRWRLDPPRRLEAWLASGRFRAMLAYQPLLLGYDDPATLARGQKVLDNGLDILTAMNRVAPDYGDLQWRMAELLDGKAGLARQAGQTARVRQYRGQSLNEALQYLDSHPLDRDRIWRALRLWPEVPAAQRLRLLRGTLREESQVWLPPPKFSSTAYARWSEQHWYLNRQWQSLGEQAEDVAGQLIETGTSQARIAYEQWPDLLAPEGVRIAAWRQVLAGQPAEAGGTLLLVDQLYDASNGLLPYSRTANLLDVAACRIRQRPMDPASAQAALAAARRRLQSLPKNWVRDQIEQVAATLSQAIDVIAGKSRPADALAWQAAVDLYWDMPPATWPSQISDWAQQADTRLGAQGAAPTILLQLAVARGDMAGRRAHE